MNTLSLWDPTHDKLSAHNGLLSYASGPPCEAQCELELGAIALAPMVACGRGGELMCGTYSMEHNALAMTDIAWSSCTKEKERETGR